VITDVLRRVDGDEEALVHGWGVERAGFGVAGDSSPAFGMTSMWGGQSLCTKVICIGTSMAWPALTALCDAREQDGTRTLKHGNDQRFTLGFFLAQRRRGAEIFSVLLGLHGCRRQSARKRFFQ